MTIPTNPSPLFEPSPIPVRTPQDCTNILRTIILQGCASTTEADVVELIYGGACVDAMVGYTNNGYESFLEYAATCVCGNVIVRALVTHGAAISRQAFINAIRTSSWWLDGPYVIDLMIGRGASMIDDTDYHPFQEAINAGDPCVMKVLVDRGCTVTDDWEKISRRAIDRREVRSIQEMTLVVDTIAFECD